ncbi:MAG: hypothetical protein ACK4ON_11405, partial [Bacteroidia bacterium]
MDFSDNYPVSKTSDISTYESCASISENVGNLLFYTNGSTVWNKSNDVMFNGNDLEIGSMTDLGSSIVQGTLILPNPAEINNYFIFQIQSGSSQGLKYTIVEINKDDEYGSVIDKNISLYTDEVTEMMQAVRHGNGQD